MITELIITKQKFLFKKIYHDCLYQFSSNINELIRSVLNFLFFLQRGITSTEKHKIAYSEQKQKNVYKKHLRGKKLLLRLFVFYAFTFNRKNKKFKTVFWCLVFFLFFLCV